MIYITSIFSCIRGELPSLRAFTLRYVASFTICEGRGGSGGKFAFRAASHELMSCREQPSREAEDFGRRPAEQDWLGRKTLRDDFGELLVGEVVGVESITDRDRPGLEEPVDSFGALPSGGVSVEHHQEAGH